MTVEERLGGQQVWFPLAEDTRAMPVQGQGVLVHVAQAAPVLLPDTCLVQYLEVSAPLVIGGESRSVVRHREIVGHRLLFQKNPDAVVGSLITFQVAESENAQSR